MTDMKKLNWLDFAKLPIIDNHLGKTFEVTKGNEIVTLVKCMAGLIGVLRIKKIDVLGCSEGYIKEKIDLLRRDLDWLEDRVKKCAYQKDRK